VRRGQAARPEDEIIVISSVRRARRIRRVRRVRRLRSLSRLKRGLWCEVRTGRLA
jgi:hypothetical protein